MGNYGISNTFGGSNLVPQEEEEASTSTINKKQDWDDPARDDRVLPRTAFPGPFRQRRYCIPRTSESKMGRGYIGVPWLRSASRRELDPNGVVDTIHAIKEYRLS